MGTLPNRHAFLLSNAADNIKDLKGKQISVTNYTAVLYAAIYAASRELDKSTRYDYRIMLLGAILIIALLSIYILIDLGRSKEKHRSRLMWIEDKYFTVEEKASLVLGSAKQPGKNDPPFFAALISVIVVGATLVGMLLWP